MRANGSVMPVDIDVVLGEHAAGLQQLLDQAKARRDELAGELAQAEVVVARLNAVLVALTGEAPVPVVDDVPVTGRMKKRPYLPAAKFQVGVLAALAGSEEPSTTRELQDRTGFTDTTVRNVLEYLRGLNPPEVRLAGTRPRPDNPGRGTRIYGILPEGRTHLAQARAAA